MYTQPALRAEWIVTYTVDLFCNNAVKLQIFVIDYLFYRVITPPLSRQDPTFMTCTENSVPKKRQLQTYVYHQLIPQTRSMMKCILFLEYCNLHRTVMLTNSFLFLLNEKENTPPILQLAYIVIAYLRL